MRHFFTDLFGVKAYVEYHYEPAEEESFNSQGSDECCEIYDVILEQGVNRICIDGESLNEETYAELRDQAIEDAKS